MTIKKQVRRRIIETVEYDVPLPISMTDLLAALKEVQENMDAKEFGSIQVEGDFKRGLVLVAEHEVTEPTPHPPLPSGLRRRRDDDPVPQSKPGRTVEDTELPGLEVDGDKPHDFQATELVPGWCKWCGGAPWTEVHGGTGEPPAPVDGADGADEPVVPPFPTTPEAGKDVELTQDLAFKILDHPGTWYFRLEGKNVKEEDKNKTRYRLRLNRAKNKHVQGDHILVETKKHRKPTALEVTIVR